MNLFKKIVCFCFSLLFYCTSMWGQCPQGNVILETQLDVDNFAADYPNCTEIISGLRIGVLTVPNTSDITDLSNLPPIESIGGSLEIVRNYDLTDLSGLENVTSIGDSLEIFANINLINLSSLANLTSIGGYLFIRSNNALTSLSGLENVTSIGGYLRIQSNANLVSLDGLENLASIGGTLLIWGNDSLTNLGSLENLTSINDDLIITQNTSLTDISGLSNLNSIGDYLTIYENTNLISLSGLEAVTSIGSYLQIEDNDSLTNLNGLANLNSIGNHLKIESNASLTNLSGLSNLDSIGSYLLIWKNTNLTDISGLENLTSIDGYLSIYDNPNLADLSGLENLTSVSDYLEIEYNTSLIDLSGLENLTSTGGYLSIWGNLTDLKGLENLTSVGGLRIRTNPDLTDLSGLESLTSINGFLEIELNANLTNLDGLGNVTSFGGSLNIRYNSTLSICEVPFICDHVFDGNYGIFNNAPGCNNTVEVFNACSFPNIYTDVFYDLNQNGTKEVDEQNYYDVSILIEPESNSYHAPNGIFYLEPGSSAAIFDEANNPNWQLTTDSTSYFLSLEEGETDTITFGIYPTQQISHIQTTINSAPARCNERITLDITTKNIGTTIASGTMWLTIDDAIPEFNFIHQPDTIIEGGINYYGWHFTDLYPGQTIIKNVGVTVPGPPDFELGEQLLFVSFSQFTDVNGEDGSEGFRYNPEVRCSYDPNDKLINPNREGDYVLFEEDLIYTVRFQNTGNDVAYDVVIRDTLDANLDLSTFRLLGSSHANRLNTILNENERILTFEFRDIFLPDSTTNFDASQGYVNYLIHTIDGLAEETPVTNSAGIYFDLNPPVITNTTQSIMVSELPTVSTEIPDNLFNFNILPNPNSGVFTVQNIPAGTYQIHNTSGQIIRQGDMKNDLLVDISRETQGVYFISITVDDSTLVRRIVKM